MIPDSGAARRASQKTASTAPILSNLSHNLFKNNTHAMMSGNPSEYDYLGLHPSAVDAYLPPCWTGILFQDYRKKNHIITFDHSTTLLETFLPHVQFFSCTVMTVTFNSSAISFSRIKLLLTKNQVCLTKCDEC